MTTMETRIQEKLNAALEPSLLEVRNDSQLHAGHKGSPNSGQSHFHITIQSTKLDGLNRVQQQRLIYKALDAELKSGIHALGIEVL